MIKPRPPRLISTRLVPSAVTVLAMCLGLTAVKFALDQRPTESMALLAAAAILDALAAGGKNRVKTIALPGLNHLFQRCRTGAVNEYAEIDETINPAALAAIGDWLAEVTRH